MLAHRRTRSPLRPSRAARALVAGLLALALLLQGYAAGLTSLLGPNHFHTVTQPDPERGGWVQGLPWVRDLIDPVLRLDRRLRAWQDELLAAQPGHSAVLSRLHGAAQTSALPTDGRAAAHHRHDHAHDGLQRHHHAADDPTVVRADLLPDTDAAAGEAAPGATLAKLPLLALPGGDGWRLRPLAVGARYPAVPALRWRDALARLPERPPRLG